MKIETGAFMKHFNNALETIGHTPLVALQKIQRDTKARIMAKLEFLNPAGSVKDRMALYMIEDAEKRGLLR